MKNTLLTSLLFLFLIHAFSQNSGYEYNGRRSPSVKKEKLNEVQVISDLSPDLWSKMILPYKESEELFLQRKYSLGYYIDPKGGYDQFIDYVTVEILAVNNGKELKAVSISDKLSEEQKSILNNADLGSDISVKIRFQFKNQNKEENGAKVMEGKVAVTIVPETEAEFPGGFRQMNEYLAKTVFNRIPERTRLYGESSISDKIRNVIVKFTVDEKGEILNAEVSRSSADLKIDNLFLEAISKMPAWKPAQNPKGVKVKQKFSIPFGGEGC